ncbi:MAG: fucose isomerase [Clostridiales bacterium]|nr:fucose isomerase [Clostridiales bacterium]
MLLGVPKILPPELIKILCEMGHGDEITLGDANFPGHTNCDTVIRMDGHGIPEILEAVLQLIPLDAYTEHPAMLMQVTPGDPTETPIWKTYEEIIARHDPRGAACLTQIERYAFYDRVKQKSCCVVMSGEGATYANIILKKGVIK